MGSVGVLKDFLFLLFLRRRNRGKREGRKGRKTGIEKKIMGKDSVEWRQTSFCDGKARKYKGKKAREREEANGSTKREEER